MMDPINGAIIICSYIVFLLKKNYFSLSKKNGGYSGYPNHPRYLDFNMGEVCFCTHSKYYVYAYSTILFGKQ